ncbi:metalloregulator ArsR/SmtB family transcription factor [Actinomycetes bacterium KLBMP 9759]
MGADRPGLRGPWRQTDVRVSPSPTPGAELTSPPGKGLRDLDDLDAVFGALAHPARRHIVQVLHARSGELTAGELAARFSHAWPTTTRHLKVLTDSGLVLARKHGRERRYTLDRHRIAAVLGLWLGSLDFKIVEE